MATWTAYASLLETLPTEKRSSLEAIAEARQCGRHNEAHQIFKSSIPNANSLPILVFEYADLLTDQGLEGERATFLEEAVGHLQLAAESSERRLLDLMLVDAQLWAYGSLRNAVKVARESRSWLGGDIAERLSDLRIRGIQLYQQLMQCGLKYSNWVNRSELTVFEEFNGNVSAECAALSISLKGQGHLAAAARMMVKQLSKTDASSRKALCQDVITFCDLLDATNSPALLYRSAYTRLSIALDYSTVLADQCRSAALAQLRNLAGISGIDWNTFAPKLFARLQIDEFRQSSSAPVEVTAALLGVADRSIDVGDYMMATQALEGAISVDKELANQAADQESAKRLWEHLTKLLDLHRQITRCLYFEASALLEILLLTDLKMKAHEKILSEAAKFDDRAPKFDLPVLRVRLYSAAMTAARDTGRDDLLDIYDRAHDKAVREYLPEEQTPVGIAQVITRIQKDFHNTLDLGRNAVEIALMWAKEQYQSEIMSQLEWEELFGFYVLKEPEGQKSPAFLDFLVCVQLEYRNFSKSFFNTSRKDWVVRFSKLRGWLVQSNDQIHWDSRSLVLNTIAKAWGFKQRSDWTEKTHSDDENARFLQDMMADTALENEVQSLDQVQATSMVGLPVATEKKDQNVFRVICQIKAPSAPSSSNASQYGELTAEVLDEAIQDSEDVFHEYEKRQNYLGMFTILRRQAELLWNKFALFKTTSLENAITVLSRAEAVYDEVRRERSVPLAHHYSIVGKMQQLHKYDASDIYGKAICWSRLAWNIHIRSLMELQTKPIAVEGAEAAREERQARLKELDAIFRESYAQFVSWIQKSKSRAIFDLLSLDSPILPELLEDCNRDPSAVDMIRRERELIQKLAQPSFPQLLKIKEESDALRGEMRKHPLLKNVMKIRDGETISLRGITEMLEGLPDGVILVDFVYVDFDKPLRALCYRKGLTYTPALMHDASMEVLTAWTKNLARPAKMPLGDVTLGRESLSKLIPILLPLFKVGRGSPNQNLGPVIRPGDTIVFCATGVLHKLPLHAIPIDGVPVIEKHPVVYCPSLTILQHCLQLLKIPQHKHAVPSRLVLNPMPIYQDKAKSEPVQSTPAVKRLAATLGATYLHGCDFTKHSIMESLNGVTTFHYHGHVQFVKGSVVKGSVVKGSAMKSYLVLDGISRDKGTSDDGCPIEKQLTAEDLLSCRLAKGALATLVGCQSGGADVSAADDVLGIPMAMYYAGAAATVSSLWRLQDKDGAAWADTFYNDLLKQGQDARQAGLEKQVPGPEKKKGPEEASSEDNDISIEKLDLAGKENDVKQGDTTKTSEKERSSTQENGLVNLALAMQRAVHCLRFDVDGKERAPYHWAGYVLSGSWFLPFTSTLPPSESS